MELSVEAFDVHLSDWVNPSALRFGRCAGHRRRLALVDLYVGKHRTDGSM